MTGGPPELVLLDVNETLVRLDPLGDRLEAAGAPRHMLQLWFASVLRDGFALAAMGESVEFRPLGEELLRTLLRGVVDDPAALATDVLDAFPTLPLHDDVVPGLERLADAGVCLATLTNGDAAVTEQLLAGTGAEGLVNARLSVDDAGLWKPAARPYQWACGFLGVPPEDTVLVAVHPWDVAGARRAGLGAAYLDRSGDGWPDAMGERPAVVASDLPSLAESLLAGSDG